jgi:hypothetical protein
MPVVLDRLFFVRNGPSEKFFFTLGRTPFIREIDPDRSWRTAPLFSTLVVCRPVIVRDDERENIFI